VTATLVLPQSLAEELDSIARHELETAGVLLVSVVQLAGENVRLLGREFVPVPDSAYLRRNEDSLTIASDGYVHALSRAELLNATALWVHTHPGDGSSPDPSSHDDVVDRQLAETFRLRSGSDYYGALIFAPRDTGIAFTGHIGIDGADGTPITRMWVVGDRFRLTHAHGLSAPSPIEIFDRNVRAFGPAIQQTLGDLTIAIVGCGGTGSAVAEQLARLGVRRFLLVDSDTLSPSNVTRVYGSGHADIGRAKVDIAANHIRQIAPEAICEELQTMITDSATAKHLRSCDLIFGCTDDNAGRLVLSRIPTYLLTPVIDCGVLLSSDEQGNLTGIDARVTTIVPEQACLLCRGRIDVARAGAELLTPQERQRLEGEGYAPALGRTEPAVVTFTTMAAATAVSELLERLIGYGPDPRPNEILLRCHEREISTNFAAPRIGHYCSESAGKVGVGMTEPFLELAWTT
jgi:hypothetical protein